VAQWQQASVPPPPDWYPDPYDPRLDRWWDGYQWTTGVRYRDRPRDRSRAVVPIVVAALSVVLLLAIVLPLVGRPTRTAATTGLAATGATPSPHVTNRFTPAFQPQVPDGVTKVFTAGGAGSWTTTSFLLHGGQTSGQVYASGPATFRLVQVAADPAAPAVPVTSCAQACTAQRWTGPSVAGLYQLQVAAPSTQTVWHLELSELRDGAFEFATATGRSGVVVYADGTRFGQGPVFTLDGPQEGDGLLHLSGTYRAQEDTWFYLVPTGRKLDRNRDLVLEAQPGTTGGWDGVTRAPGRYTLLVLVQPMGAWSFTVGGP
jgi:hypothetical protein